MTDLILCFIAGFSLLGGLVLFHASTLLVFTPALDIRYYDFQLLSNLLTDPGILFVYGITIATHISVAVIVTIIFTFIQCQTSMSDLLLICVTPAIVCILMKLINLLKLLLIPNSFPPKSILTRRNLLFIYLKNDLLEFVLGHTANTFTLCVGSFIGSFIIKAYIFEYVSCFR